MSCQPQFEESGIRPDWLVCPALLIFEKKGGDQMIKIICMLFASFLFWLQSLFMPVVAVAAYTSLVTSTDFTAIATDVGTAVAGIISIALIILGASLLMKAFGR